MLNPKAKDSSSPSIGSLPRIADFNPKQVLAELVSAAERALQARRNRTYPPKPHYYVLELYAANEDEEIESLCNQGKEGLQTSLLLNFAKILPPKLLTSTIQAGLLGSIINSLNAGVGFPTFPDHPEQTIAAVAAVLLRDKHEGLAGLGRWIDAQLGDVLDEIEKTAVNIAADLEGERGEIGMPGVASLTSYQRSQDGLIHASDQPVKDDVVVSFTKLVRIKSLPLSLFLTLPCKSVGSAGPASPTTVGRKRKPPQLPGTRLRRMVRRRVGTGPAE
ncbi:hypothetical protein FB451DRAFT_1225178 [Mycena latifolia]|nr:hypothetical protein FB451DRAFT_1225178 [Mycena latifolia]